MATSRAFGILNNQNIVAGNQPFGKSIQAAKTGESRPSAFALKDLTNKNQRTVVHQDGKGKANNGPADNALKAKTNAILQTLSKDFTKPAAASRKKQQSSSGYDDHFSPQNDEYAWGQASCLREDLLDQMLDFPDVRQYEVKRKLPKPARSDLLDLPDLDAGWDYFEPASAPHRQNSRKPLDLPGDDFPLVDIQDLEFIF
uniref:Uncharacterized protein n=1 Tax=Anopheles atroparvus TaxID=41427 RepID=A0AAG5DG65_ANOAO